MEAVRQDMTLTTKEMDEPVHGQNRAPARCLPLVQLTYARVPSSSPLSLYVRPLQSSWVIRLSSSSRRMDLFVQNVAKVAPLTLAQRFRTEQFKPPTLLHLHERVPVGMTPDMIYGKYSDLVVHKDKLALGN